MKRLACAALITTAALITGCASTWRVDSDVSTFSSMPAVPAGATYRFERLPSQQAYGEQQAALEKIVEQSLAKVGLARSEGAARFSVQIGARAQREASVWDDNWGFPGRDFIVTPSGRLVWTQPLMRPEPPTFRREVSIVMRDIGNSQIVYETHAVHEGRWADSTLILPALFDSALSDFPRPSQGVKKVEVTVSLEPKK